MMDLAVVVESWIECRSVIDPISYVWVGCGDDGRDEMVADGPLIQLVGLVCDAAMVQANGSSFRHYAVSAINGRGPNANHPSALITHSFQVHDGFPMER